MRRIRDREYKTCGECGSRQMVRDEAFGCETCGKAIDLALTPSGNHAYLEAMVFRHGEAEAEHLRFCSWACALTRLRQVQSANFVSLPFLVYDAVHEPGLRAEDFFAALGVARAASRKKSSGGGRSRPSRSGA